MNKKLIGICVCILFFGASVCPSIAGYEKVIDKKEINDYNNLIKYAIESGVLSNNDWLEQGKLLASDGEFGDLFALSVSIDGDYAIIGSPEDDDNGEGSGSAYIFKRDGTNWVEEDKLTASDGESYDQFGYSVSISGDYALIGTWRDDNWRGSAYVFHRDGTNWVEEDKLTASDGEAYDQFGWSVSIDGVYALIGAPYDNDKGDDSGSAYVFKRDGASWNQEAKLIASDGDAGDRLSGSISLSGDYAFIGATGDENYRGSAYVFHRDGTNWVEEDKLIASDGEEIDTFGVSVSKSGDYVVIGAVGDENYGGSAYVFHRDGTNWVEEDKLIASDGTENDFFGYSVSIDGDTVFIGAPYDDDKGDDSGSAYVFKRDGASWIQEDKLIASDGAAGDDFGGSVSIDGDYAIIGAWYDDDNGDNSGSAYIFVNSGGNQPPSVEITYPNEDQTIIGTITIQGTADDQDGTVQQVEIKIDNDNWDTAGGTTSWMYDWDSTLVTNGIHSISARSFDGEDYSAENKVDVIVKNGDFEIIGFSPIDLQVTDTEGQYINKDESNIPGATYTEEDINGDGDPDDKIVIPDAINGLYSIEVIPEPDAEPTDTYSLMVNYTGTSYYLAEDEMIQDIPLEGYGMSWPDKPSTPDGPASGNVGESYTYTSSTSDPDGDQIYYLFDWSDGTDSGWIETGEASHSWTEEGDYEIKVKAKDIHGFESDWSDPLIVTMPRNRAIQRPFLNYLQNFLQQYPILYQLMLRFLRL